MQLQSKKGARILRIDFVLLLLALTFVMFEANAQLSSFKQGTAIKDFGKYTDVKNHGLNETSVFKVAFDVGKEAKAGEINRKFDSLARFINMHVAHGVPLENIQLALVVHGKASFDLLDNLTYQKLYKKDNPNKALLLALMQTNVSVELCGQTAGAYEIDESQLVSGVKVSLSAMTAHAKLQQQGYTVNPF